MRRVTIFVSAFLLLCPLTLRAQTTDDRDLAVLTKSMESGPADQRLAFNVLLVAFSTFRDAHLRHETCHTAESCIERRASERTRYDHDFLLMAHGFSPGPAPTFTSDDLVAADGTLNSYFEKVSGILPVTCSGSNCLSQSTFREVQRDWIRYRDAWITFGTLRWPTISSETWRTYLTQQRSAQMLADFHAILCCS